MMLLLTDRRALVSRNRAEGSTGSLGRFRTPPVKGWRFLTSTTNLLSLEARGIVSSPAQPLILGKRRRRSPYGLRLRVHFFSQTQLNEPDRFYRDSLLATLEKLTTCTSKE